MGNNLNLTWPSGGILPSTFDPFALTTLRLGAKVARATKVLPQSATESLYTIAGGRVLVRMLIAQVTVAIQAQATTIKVNANPTVGSSLDLCTTVDLNGLAAGVLVGFPGAVGSAATQGLAVVEQSIGWVCDVGTIDAITVASSTGQLKWDLFYFPLDQGATIVAA